jgi:hypothetical protein
MISFNICSRLAFSIILLPTPQFTFLINLFILTVSNPYKYHSFSFIFHLASSLALKGGDSTERGVGLGGSPQFTQFFIKKIPTLRLIRGKNHPKLV